jgi:hypothetical protein
MPIVFHSTARLDDSKDSLRRQGLGFAQESFIAGFGSGLGKGRQCHESIGCRRKRTAAGSDSAQSLLPERESVQKPLLLGDELLHTFARQSQHA